MLELQGNRDTRFSVIFCIRRYKPGICSLLCCLRISSFLLPAERTFHGKAAVIGIEGLETVFKGGREILQLVHRLIIIGYENGSLLNTGRVLIFIHIFWFTGRLCTFNLHMEGLSQRFIVALIRHSRHSVGGINFVPVSVVVRIVLRAGRQCFAYPFIPFPVACHRITGDTGNDHAGDHLRACRL